MGPLRADLLKKELDIHTFKDLLECYPFRHVDRTKVSSIRELHPGIDYVQIAGKISTKEIIGENRAKRLVCEIRDVTGSLELVWFQGINYLQKSISIGQQYLVYGKLSFFQGSPQITHPEMELMGESSSEAKSYLEPVYPSTEKLKSRSLGGRQMAKLTMALWQQIKEQDLLENLPGFLLEKHAFPSRYQALGWIHFPSNATVYKKAVERLKFEELFIAHLRMGLIKLKRHHSSRGVVFGQVGDVFHDFYQHHLPFPLTGAQKRVIKEIRKDCATGKQMNRLLQGDVGSGKTIVALCIMLLAKGNGYQACLLAPTEILSQQHFHNISRLLEKIPVKVALLTGSVKSAQRKKVLKELAEGSIDFLVGTHAILEDPVVFKNLGLAIVDEQHRFGVAQRAKLWTKAPIPPHMLVMTATPIPRTLAMTAYGDLDYSVIDELPPNRKPIHTVHRFETARHQVMGFMKEEILKGRQVYIIFPLIEESEKLDYENLMKGYENVQAWFPEPKYWISMVHGRQTHEVRETNMKRFKDGETQIMVATTVIEVGVDVPNASVMIIESSEKFGLSQLHQLRGRVGRGSEKSYCILLTGNKLSQEARERLNTMCETGDGFKIAEKDLELRGPGDIEGTRQSGMLNFKLASFVDDREWFEAAAVAAEEVLENDPDLNSAGNLPLKNYLVSLKGKTAWSKIS